MNAQQQQQQQQPPEKASYSTKTMLRMREKKKGIASVSSLPFQWSALKYG